jgi:hypothetical protein
MHIDQEQGPYMKDSFKYTCWNDPITEIPVSTIGQKTLGEKCVQ